MTALTCIYCRAAFGGRAGSVYCSDRCKRRYAYVRLQVIAKAKGVTVDSVRLAERQRRLSPPSHAPLALTFND